MTDTLHDVLDIEPNTPSTSLTKSEPVDAEMVDAEPSSSSSPATADGIPVNHGLENDLEFTRRTLKQVIESAQITLQSSIEEAETSGEARAYEVVATLVQSIVNANKELVILHKSRAEARKIGAETKVPGASTAAGGPINIERAVFVGKAQDLLRQLRAEQLKVAQESADK